MLNFLLLAGAGILLGISLAGPPGPVTAIMVERSVQSALRGFSVGLGAMTADFTLMIIIFTIGSTLDLTRYNDYIFIAGAVFFLYLAYAIFKSGNLQTPKGIPASGYLTGLSIGLINPMQIAWWLTAGLSVLQKFGVTTMIFLFIGIIIWTSFLATVVHRASMKYEREVIFGVKIFSISALTVFGIYFLIMALAGLKII